MDDDGQQGDGGNVFTAKLGPLAGWQWLAVLTLVGVAFWLWTSSRKNAAAAAAQQQPASVPSQDVPQFVIQNTFPLPPYAPTPAATQPTNPTTGTVTPVPSPAPTPVQAPPTPNPGVTNPTKLIPAPAHRSPSPTGHTVKVTRWTARNTAWSSTVSGIASHFGIRNWQSVWNAPQNAALRAKRKRPELIQPGDQIYVPA